MAGSIYFEKDRGRWVVSWRSGNGRAVKIRQYNQQFMPCTHYGHDGVPDRRRCQGYKTAVKLLAMVQARWEQYQQGKCDFRIEEFTGSDWSDVIEFYGQWMKDVVVPNRTPATIHCYESYLANWIKPFFDAHPCRLHEIRHDTLNKLMTSITLAPKGKLNVMMAVRSMLGYAWRCERIPKVPPFPKREQYGIVRSTPDWLTIDERDKVMAQIPDADRAIFQWLNLHYRRPGEACALYKTDFDQINRAFWIRRALSKRIVCHATKTHKEHYIPCAEEFLATARRLASGVDDSPYLFVNPRSRKHQGRYTLEALRIIWYAACDAAGVRRIWLYRGTKHTSCTAFIEDGGTIDELQMLTDHARRDSLKHYADITLNRKRMLMERNRKRMTG
ncbi:MAG: tyrosine-type recombinase/integrase [Desulfobacteraceae bacterium]|nr:tyrosine-type recombinase/integrase [Desulfobacteraceae bacterium]